MQCEHDEKCYNGHCKKVHTCKWGTTKCGEKNCVSTSLNLSTCSI